MTTRCSRSSSGASRHPRGPRSPVPVARPRARGACGGGVASRGRRRGADGDRDHPRAPRDARRIDALAPSHDLLWTTSYPYHTHALGLRAARRHRKPLVADLRDPWTPNWVHRRKFAPTRGSRRRGAGGDRGRRRRRGHHRDPRRALPRRCSPRRRGSPRVHNASTRRTRRGAPKPTRDGRAAAGVHFGNVYGPWSLRHALRALAALRREGALPHGVDRTSASSPTATARLAQPTGPG
jgi:hypothetical protein